MRFEVPMKNLEHPNTAPDDFSDLTLRIQRAMRQCGRDVLIRHKREGFPIVSWKDGKVLLIAPEEIVIPPAEK